MAIERTDPFRYMPSGIDRMRLARDLDLSGCFLQKPVEPLSIDATPNWRQRRQMALRVFEELWRTTIDEFGQPAEFDLVACAFESSCERLAEFDRTAGRAPAARRQKISGARQKRGRGADRE